MKSVLSFFILLSLGPGPGDATFAQSNCERILNEFISVPGITAYNRTVVARAINNEILLLLSGRHLDKAALSWAQSFDVINEILSYVVENAIQHGSKEFEQGTWKKASLPIKVQLYSDTSDVNVVISNPKIKPFPSSLLREFKAGEHISVPDSQRVGFKGHGLAHVGIFLHLEKLPPNSSAKWEVTNSDVHFTLRLHLH